MIKAVIFDLGGVVLKNGVVAAYSKYPAFEKIFKEKYILKVELGQMSEDELWKGLTVDLPEVNIGELKDYIFSQFAPIKEVWQLIDSLRGKYKLGLLTNNIKGWVERLDKRFNFHSLFGVIVDSSQVGIRKPNSAIYLLAADKLNVKPQECIFIDDLEENAVGARKAGMYGIWFKDPSQLEEELKKLKVL